jgi:hypothetical protein
MAKITGFDLYDVRFPTSLTFDGADAMNPDPDYAAAYVVIRADDDSAGHGFAFTIGRGNEVQLAAIAAIKPFLVGADVEETCANLGAVSRALVNESHLQWLGPEKGVMHMAIGAVVNALFDLAARRAGLPLWRYLATKSPKELCELVDFRYLSDALTRAEALEILKEGTQGRQTRNSSDRCLSGRWRAREHREPLVGSKVGRKGVSSRWRSGTLRDRATPGVLRLCGGVVFDGGAPCRVDRPPARTLLGSRRRRTRTLSRTACPWGLDGDESGLSRHVCLPERIGLGSTLAVMIADLGILGQ